MQIVCGDENGLIKKMDLQSGRVLERWQFPEQGISIVEIKVFNNQILGIAEKQQVFILNESLGFMNLTQSTLCDSKIAQFHLYQSAQDKLDNLVNIILPFTNGTIGCLVYNVLENKFMNEFLMYKTDTILNSSCLKKNLLLLMWVGKPPCILNIDEHQVVWQARNLQNDIYDLQVKMNDRDGLFLDDYTIAVITMTGEIRSYDISKNNERPFAIFDIKKYNKTAPSKLTYNYAKQLFYVANIKGEVLILDHKKNYMEVGKLKGSQGSLRGTYFDDKTQYVMTISIDRHLRVYENINSHKVIIQHNLQTRPSSAAFFTPNVENLQEQEITKQQWNVHTGQQARDRFKYQRKHTIKLNYLKGMFENQKVIIKQNKDKDEKKRIQQEILDQQRMQEQQEQAAQQELNEAYEEDQQMKRMSKRERVPAIKKRLQKPSKLIKKQKK